jgi:hypothetical protein
MISKIVQIGNVSFPSFNEERLYQIPFKKNIPLPEELSHWQPTVDSMLVGVDTDEEMYLMVDQGTVEKGTTQRREGVHIDGNWEITGHSTGHRVMAWDTGGGRWSTKNLTTGGIILASNINGTKAYEGEVAGIVGEGGDCSHLDLRGLHTVEMQSNVAYLGNVTMLHEAVPAPQAHNRTLVRITLPASYAA